MSSSVRASRNGQVLILTLENPDGYPRLERAAIELLLGKMREAQFEPSICGCVITGTDRAFAAGAEIDELARLTAVAAHDFSRMGQRLMSTVGQSEKPVVAAIRGYCFGGGLDLALACRARVASENATFAHPGGAIGIITGWGGTQRLTRLIGRSRAMDMLSTGRAVSAREALDLGLVNRVVAEDEVVTYSIELASRCKR